METNLWKKYKNNSDLERFCEGYKTFISDCKTERECIKYAIAAAEAAGYKSLRDLIK